MAFAILRTNKIKSLSGVHAVLRHTKRCVDCVTVVDKNVKNPKLFFDKMSEDTKLPYSKFFKERTKGQTVRRDSVKAVEVVATFTKGGLLHEEIKPWINSTIQFLAEKFGGWQNIYSVDFHVDELGGNIENKEESPLGHIHAIIIPIDSKGRLNCREFLGGAQKMRELQSDYQKTVSCFGLERGKDKRLSKAKHKSSVEWHKEQAKKEVELKSYKEMFGMPDEWDFEKKLKYYDVYNKFLNKAEMFENKINIEEKNI